MSFVFFMEQPLSFIQTNLFNDKWDTGIKIPCIRCVNRVDSNEGAHNEPLHLI